MPDSFEFGGNVVWKPTPDYIEHANLTRFMRQHGSKDFKELMHRSTKEVAWFTDVGVATCERAIFPGGGFGRRHPIPEMVRRREDEHHP